MEKKLIKKRLVFAMIFLFIDAGVVSALNVNPYNKFEPEGNGNWFYVGGSGPGNYSKIQDAIDNASDGDTVFVYDDSSPYYENLVIGKSINLVGEYKETTVIDGDGFDNAIIVYANKVSISGFTIQNSFGMIDIAAGIRIYSSYNTISGNIIANNSGEADGIRFSGCNNTIKSNIFTNNGHVGIMSVDTSNNNTISENIITNNSYSGIMLFYNNCNNMIIGNTITLNGYTGYGGVFVVDGNNNTISYNTFIENWGGIILSGSNNIISGNILRNNLIDSIALSGDNNTVFENTITKNSDGINLGYGTNHNKIINNTIITNTHFGIGLSIGSNNIISGNTIMNNIYGIFFFNTHDVENCLIYHNNLINNIQNAYDANKKNNTWYNSSLHEGNYWSDYTGNDLNGDGVGDTPYSIPGEENQDLYPLMNLDFQKTIIFGKITNLSTQGEYITFEAVKIKMIIFSGFSLNNYISGEQIIILKDYRGLVGVRYILAFCKTININSIIGFHTKMGETQ